jgi:molybdenum cofactor cytidylyltransferase
MISLIVLAAGKSVRMHGRNKLLAKIEGKPMIRRVVETALSSKVDEVIVVLGWGADKIRAALSDLPCRLIVNKNYEGGQSVSIKVGLREVGKTARAVLILPGDVAMIDTHSINSVLDGYSKYNKPILIASHDGKQGHPILLARSLFTEIEAIDEQTYGLKSVVQSHERELELIETGSENVLKDCDTPEDLRRLQRSR